MVTDTGVSINPDTTFDTCPRDVDVLFVPGAVDNVKLMKDEPSIAQPIPVGDGATLLARRPDVRAAERRLAAATARIGVATADLYSSRIG